MILRVGLPVWKGRISPVLDVAERLLVVDVAAGREVSRSVVEVGAGLLPHRVHRLSDLGVDIIVCGAVSRQMANMLTGLGITVYPCMRGEVDNVLASLLRTGSPDPSFFMPGYDGRAARRRWRGGRGRMGR
jgi:predicted Fe-Mo cluster-binding NifX family protein